MLVIMTMLVRMMLIKNTHQSDTCQNDAHLNDSLQNGTCQNDIQKINTCQNDPCQNDAPQKGGINE